MIQPFDATNWYWFVGGDETRVWSSAKSRYYQVSNADYHAWLSAGWTETRIASEAELSDVLRPYGLRGPHVLPSDVHAERDRRLAMGFDFDFGDARGVHRIRTSIADMIGWDEVSKFASALLALGQTTQPITIATGTGVTQVTPVEWQMVMLAAAAFRQPIWGASFILENMNPIPADFRNDAYWEIANAPA